MKIILENFVGSSVAFFVLFFLLRNWILERLRISLQKEHSIFLNELKWDYKVKEQAARMAEYLALARRLREDSPEADYRKANQLSWELAMWLPEDIYKEMSVALVRPNSEVNELSVVVSIRKLLLKDKSGNLSIEDIAHHAPGIGKSNSRNS